MGWKTQCILIDQLHPHGPAGVLEALGMANPTRGKQRAVDEVFLPGDRTYATEFDDTTLVFDAKITDGALTGELSMQRLAAELPGCAVLVVELHSGVNLYAFALFENGKLVRGKAGCTEEGIMMNVGTPPEFEREVLEVFRPLSETTFTDPHGEIWEHDQLGSEFVFEGMRRFLGFRPDHEPDEDGLTGWPVWAYTSGTRPVARSVPQRRAPIDRELDRRPYRERHPVDPPSSATKFAEEIERLIAADITFISKLHSQGELEAEIQWRDRTKITFKGRGDTPEIRRRDVYEQIRRHHQAHFGGGRGPGSRGHK